MCIVFSVKHISITDAKVGVKDHEIFRLRDKGNYELVILYENTTASIAVNTHTWHDILAHFLHSTEEKKHIEVIIVCVCNPPPKLLTMNSLTIRDMLYNVYYLGL
jgi:hypothetical protein